MIILLLTMMAAQPVVAAAEKYISGISIVFYALLLAVSLAVNLLWPRDRGHAPLQWAYGLFLSSTVIATSIRFWTNAEFSVDDFIQIFRIVLAYSLFLTGTAISPIRDRKLTTRVALAVVLLTGLGQLVAAALHIRFNAGLFELADYRYALIGLTVHPAITATLLLSAVAILLPTEADGSLKARDWELTLRPLALGLALLLAVATFRRSAWVYSGMVTVGLAAFAINRSRRSASSLALAAFLAAAFLASIGPIVELLSANSGIGRAAYMRTLDLFGSHATGSGRFVFWPIVVQLFRSGTFFEQVFGIGTVALREHLRESFGIEIGAHNDLLNVLLVEGIAAAALFAGLLAGLVTSIIRAARAGNDMILGTCLALAIVSLSMTTGGLLDPQFCLVHLYLGSILSRAATRLGGPGRHPGLTENHRTVVEQRRR